MELSIYIGKIYQKYQNFYYAKREWHDDKIIKIEIERDDMHYLKEWMKQEFPNEFIYGNETSYYNGKAVLVLSWSISEEVYFLSEGRLAEEFRKDGLHSVIEDFYNHQKKVKMSQPKMDKNNKIFVGENKSDEVKCMEEVLNYFFHRNKSLNSINLVYCNAILSKIESYLSTVVKNKMLYDFPDFSFNGGIIEHFKVSSSKENRKGSEEIISSIRYNAKIDKDFDMAVKSGKIKTNKDIENFQVEERNISGCSVENFQQNFKNNFDNHLKSLDNYQIKNDICIFLIQGIGNPPFYKEANKIFTYGIHLDYSLLTYLKEKNKGVDYIIFDWYGNLEIIDLSKIDDMINNCIPNKKWEIKNGKETIQFRVEPWPYFKGI